MGLVGSARHLPERRTGRRDQPFGTRTTNRGVRGLVSIAVERYLDDKLEVVTVRAQSIVQVKLAFMFNVWPEMKDDTRKDRHRTR